MAERSRPWDGIVTGDAGPYSFDQWTDIYKTLLAPTIASDGVFLDQLNMFDLSSVAATPVSVASGRALVNGIWYESDAAVSLAIANATAGNVRVDRIVLRADWALQTVRLTVVQGTNVASNPVPPALVQVNGTTWDVPLWEVQATDAGVLTFFADDREFIGPNLYHGMVGTWEEDDMYEGSNHITGDRRFWDISIGTGGSLDILAGVSFGAIRWQTDGTLGAADIRMFGPGVRSAASPRCELRVKEPGSHADLDRTIGLTDQSLTLTPTNGMFFRSTGTGQWEAVCRAAGAETVVPNVQALTDVWKLFEVRPAGSNVVTFKIDGVVVATISADIPTADVSVQLGTFDDGASAPAADNYMDFDRLRLRTLTR